MPTLTLKRTQQWQPSWKVFISLGSGCGILRRPGQWGEGYWGTGSWIPQQ